MKLGLSVWKTSPNCKANVWQQHQGRSTAHTLSYMEGIQPEFSIYLYIYIHYIYVYYIYIYMYILYIYMYIYIYIYVYIIYICIYIYIIYIYIYYTHISRSLGCYQGIRPRHGHRNGKTRWKAWKKMVLLVFFWTCVTLKKKNTRTTRATIYPTKPPSSLKRDAWFPTGAGTNLCNCNKPVCDSWGQDHEIV